MHKVFGLALEWALWPADWRFFWRSARQIWRLSYLRRIDPYDPTDGVRVFCIDYYRRIPVAVVVRPRESMILHVCLITRFEAGKTTGKTARCTRFTGTCTTLESTTHI